MRCLKAACETLIANLLLQGMQTMLRNDHWILLSDTHTVDGLNNTSHNFVGFLIDFCTQYPHCPSRILNWKLRGRWRMRLLVAGWSDMWGATVFVPGG